MSWSSEHRGFVIEAFFKNNDSVTATQGISDALWALCNSCRSWSKNNPAMGFKRESKWVSIIKETKWSSSER